MTHERLFGYRHAFDHPVTLWLTAGIGGALVLAMLAITVIPAGPELRRELWKRTLSWAVIAPLLVGPILLGAAPAIGVVSIVCLWCYAEYARATGLFREKLTSFVVVVAILTVLFTVADHWYGFFLALAPLSVGVIAATAILVDEPKGYVQRVALGVLGFMFFGCGLGHLGYVANDWNYRPMMLMLLTTVQMNDIFAFCVGKLFGRRKLAPNTSPNKTVAGSLGALVLTAALTAVLGHYVFLGTPMDRPARLIVLGVLVSIVGQLGDLTLSSIKRDIGIKDMAATIPGHGGVLDRFNSVLFVAPTFFHFVHFYNGIGLDQPVRIITGG